MFEALNFPNRITIELTNRCNMSCDFCPRHCTDMELGDMDEQLFYKIADEATLHLPVAIVMFFRGESLLYKELPEMIAYAKKKGLGPIQLFSNGLALSEELAVRLVKSGLDFICFSMDTVNKTLYERHRIYGNLEVSTNNVLSFLKICEKYKREGFHVPQTQVSMVDIKEYRPYKEQFIDFWRKHVDIVRVYYEHDSNGRMVDIDSKGEEYQFVSRKPCRKIFTDMIIYWDGRIALCNYDWNEKIELGNLNNQSIYDIWHSERFEEIRNMHRNNSFPDNLICRDCDHWIIAYMPEGHVGELYRKYDQK